MSLDNAIHSECETYDNNNLIDNDHIISYLSEHIPFDEMKQIVNKFHTELKNQTNESIALNIIEIYKSKNIELLKDFKSDNSSASLSSFIPVVCKVNAMWQFSGNSRKYLNNKIDLSIGSLALIAMTYDDSINNAQDLLVPIAIAYSHLLPSDSSIKLSLDDIRNNEAITTAKSIIKSVLNSINKELVQGSVTSIYKVVPLIGGVVSKTMDNMANKILDNVFIASDKIFSDTNLQRLYEEYEKIKPSKEPEKEHLKSELTPDEIRRWAQVDRELTIKKPEKRENISTWETVIALLGGVAGFCYSSGLFSTILWSILGTIITAGILGALYIIYAAIFIDPKIKAYNDARQKAYNELVEKENS